MCSEIIESLQSPSEGAKFGLSNKLKEWTESPVKYKLTDMSNSIETPIDIDFFGGIDIGIELILATSEKLTLALALIFLILKD